MVSMQENLHLYTCEFYSAIEFNQWFFFPEELKHGDNIMENNDLLLVGILDRSGSMMSLIDEMRDGFNTFKKTQLKEIGETYLTLSIFDDKVDRLYTGSNLKFVPDLTPGNYYVRGNTALLDAIGDTLTDVAEMPNRPKKVLVVIATDGYENSSRRFTKHQISKMISKYQNQKKDPWAFVFMGAGVDAFSDRLRLGNNVYSALNVTPNREGINVFYNSVETVSNAYRGGAMGQSLSVSQNSNVDYGNNPDTTNVK